MNLTGYTQISVWIASVASLHVPDFPVISCSMLVGALISSDGRNDLEVSIVVFNVD